MRAKITGFLHGVTEAISGLLPVEHHEKKTTSRKKVSSRKRSPERLGTTQKQKTRNVGSAKGRKAQLPREPKSIKTITDKSIATQAAQAVIYSCPACGLQAPKTLMIEHLLGSPIHQRGRFHPEQTTDHRVEKEPATRPRKEDSRDSLRNLLQILLPPRAFGRRHEGRTSTLSTNPG